MSFLSDVFGSKPQVAGFTDLNLGTEQLDALNEDIAAWPEISQLGSLYQDAMLNQLDAAFGGGGAFRNILKQGGANVAEMGTQASQELQGQIPQDVQEAVQRTSAFQNLLSGGGGGMASANTARNFGLTSLDLIGQGAQLAGKAGNAAQQWAALSQANLPAGMLITPQQQAQFDTNQALIQRNIQQQRYNVAAAPDPALQALNQWVEQVGGTVVGSYLGGGAGGMGGGGKGGGNYMTSYNPNSYGTSDLGYMGAPPAGAGPSDVSSPGFYTTGAGGGAAGSDPYGISAGAAIGAGAPTMPPAGYAPYQSNIAPNPFGGSTTTLDMGGNPLPYGGYPTTSNIDYAGGYLGGAYG